MVDSLTNPTSMQHERLTAMAYFFRQFYEDGSGTQWYLTRNSDEENSLSVHSYDDKPCACSRRAKYSLPEFFAKLSDTPECFELLSLLEQKAGIAAYRLNRTKELAPMLPAFKNIIEKIADQPFQW